MSVNQRLSPLVNRNAETTKDEAAVPKTACVRFVLGAGRCGRRRGDRNPETDTEPVSARARARNAGLCGLAGERPPETG